MNDEVAIVMAKLAGVRRTLAALMKEEPNKRAPVEWLKPWQEFPPEMVLHHFVQATGLIERLKVLLPDLYGDFHWVNPEPKVPMSGGGVHFGRPQVAELLRAIDQVFEIRANSELSPPTPSSQRRVFISHGRSPDWHKVQAFVEHDVKLKSLELAQEPSRGRTVIEKLEQNAAQCDSALIVMTGDDLANNDEARVRENVMHEIGFFQGRYGRQAVILLHEEGVSVPSNLGGIVYIPVPKGTIEATFHVIQRELNALYHLT
jgi:predicted nucleotide-binding protein